MTTHPLQNRHASPPHSQRNFPGTPEVNRLAPPATPLASQDIAPPKSPRTNGEEVDQFEATVNRGRPRVQRNLPEGPIYHDFGDQDVGEHNVGNRYVGERNFSDQDVHKPARPASIHGRKQFQRRK